MAGEISNDITTSLRYLEEGGGRPVTMMGGADGEESECSGTYVPTPVVMHDGRRSSPPATLAHQGFELRSHRTGVADLYDDEALRRVYYREMESLLQQATGAVRVIVFDHNTRSAATAPANNDTRRPVHLVHNDFTTDSGPQRVRRELGDDTADSLLEHPFVIVNLWRPIKGPVESVPLAVCDAKSIATRDLVVADLVYEHRTGHEYRATFRSEHRWFYYPRMQADEVLLIKVFDSQTGGANRCGLHTAFDDPTTTPDAAPRESIEVRAFAFFA